MQASQNRAADTSTAAQITPAGEVDAGRPATLYLPAPAWATSHDEYAGGVNWYRRVTIPLPTSHPLAEESEITVSAAVDDEIEIDGKGARLRRNGPPAIYLGDYRMTPEQAEQLAAALEDLARAIDGA